MRMYLEQKNTHFFSPDLINKERPEDILFFPWFSYEYAGNDVHLCPTDTKQPGVSTNSSQQFIFLAQRVRDQTKSIKREFLRSFILTFALLTILSLSAIMGTFAIPIKNAYESGLPKSPATITVSPPEVSSRKTASSHEVAVKTTNTRHQQSNTSTAIRCSVQHIVINGETLSSIASKYSIDWPQLASINHLSDPNQIMAGQNICIPAESSSSHNTSLPLSPSVVPIIGQFNFFSYGQCTWWADERYHQLHGIYVPWSTKANAWQWATRALDFGWHVSPTPQVGDIIDLQPNIQGASNLGHVAVVERILSNGHVITSNLNWGSNPAKVTYIEFAPGPGVNFIHQ
jgi:surface antigen